MRIAAHANASAAASVSIWPASANRASEPASTAPTNSTPMKPAVKAKAMPSRRLLLVGSM
jgi:hypothetical protein